MSKPKFENKKGKKLNTLKATAMTQNLKSYPPKRKEKKKGGLKSTIS